ncbi:hypothetical protein A6V36_28950 [Paraburkholderia ginsengiterrae]|uniref:Uncharacterized protein n=1 Tax=Paraburkholderia ginsengiterrae TaxID=1462993 RepID=A0A1A9MZY9_9BURK|nr:hypothetical protein A6V37_09095 [Paraburkholderia ginsengiterrae]OAJ59076.1 hypothetical protein A6V36_28950 [Paraburkholderia ginsengiterrae]
MAASVFKDFNKADARRSELGQRILTGARMRSPNEVSPVTLCAQISIVSSGTFRRLLQPGLPGRVTGR